MATATRTRTLTVTCPHCLSDDDTVKLDLNDLAVCTCTGCDAEFSPREAAELFEDLAARWRAVAAWVDAAPVL